MNKYSSLRSNMGWADIAQDLSVINPPKGMTSTSIKEPSSDCIFRESQDHLRQIVIPSASTTRPSSDSHNLTSTDSESRNPVKKQTWRSIFSVFPSTIKFKKPHIEEKSFTKLKGKPLDCSNPRPILKDELGTTQKPTDINSQRPRAVNHESPEYKFLQGSMFSNGIGMHNSDPDKALQLYTEAAKEGHLEAQTRLGYKYATGSGVGQNANTAIEWLKQSAIRGSDKATLMLGVMYEDGLGVPVDNRKARSWYTVSAKQNNAEAQFRLGSMASNGLGATATDPYLSARLYRQAADKGHPAAQTRLGYKYATGSGVEYNFNTGLNWLHQAAKLGYVPAQERLGNILYHMKQYSTAYEWLNMAASHNCSPKAFLMMSDMYKNGLGVRQNLDMARAFRDMAENPESIENKFWIGCLIESGKEGTRDTRTARKWYSKAANLGHTKAMTKLQFVYADGIIKHVYTGANRI